MRGLLIAATTGLVLGGTSLGQSEAAKRDMGDAPSPRFVSTDTLLDAKIKARSEEKETGNLDDLVVDTRTGRIAFAIVDTNGILDTDNKTVAIPYGALSWDSSNERYILDATAEQIRNLPKWDSKDLAMLRDTSWFGKLKGVFGDRSELESIEEGYAYHGDEYTMCFAHPNHPKSTTLDGKIVSIDRNSMTGQGHACCTAVVEDEKGVKHTVYLAPASHLQSKSISPAEGSQVSIGTIEALDGTGKPVRVAQWIKVDGNTVHVRDDRGVPAWHVGGGEIQPYYILASDMDNGKLYTNGEAFGSVNDIVFDAHSGTAAFAVISVGGVLGVDDTLYPIPWNAVAMGKDDSLVINMPESKLKLAPKFSKDGVKDLNNEQFKKQVVTYYGMEPARYDTDRAAKWTNHRQASAE